MTDTNIDTNNVTKTDTKTEAANVLEIAGRLKTVREDLKNSQKEISAALSSGRIDYSKTNGAVVELPSSLLYDMGTRHNISADWLLFGKEPMMMTHIDPEAASIVSQLDVQSMEMVRTMEEFPLLKYKLLELYDNFKKENQTLIDKAVSGSIDA